MVGYDADRLTVESSKTNDDIFGVAGLYFEEFVVIDDRPDHFVHVVGLIGTVGDDLVQVVVEAVDRVVAFHIGSFFKDFSGIINSIRDRSKS